MKTLVALMALAVAAPAFAAPQTRPHVDAHGCLVTAVIGRDGGVLHTFATNPGQIECLIPEDGPDEDFFKDLMDRISGPAPIPEDEVVEAL